MNGSRQQPAPTPYLLHKMRPQDIRQVVEIDQLSFATPWSYSAYQYELSDNNYSQMMVITLPVAQAGLFSASGGSANGWPASSGSRANGAGWARLFGWLRGRFAANGESDDLVIGYGGFWRARGDAHISTIAVRPEYRGRSLGELLLAAMIRRAIMLNAQSCSLEVRISNAPAIALYRKYGFAFHGVKVGYYRDNREDAYDMRIPALDAVYQAALAARWAALAARLPFEDNFTALPVGPGR